MFFDSSSTKHASVNPSDSVSDLCVHPSFDIFAATTWENSIYFYDFTLNHKNTTKLSVPLLTGCFFDSSKVAAGGVNGSLFLNDLNTNQTNEIKAHDQGIQKCKIYNNILITASWDHKLKFWDLRSDQPVHTLDTVEKVYAMDVYNDNIVIALSNNQVVYYNIKDLQSKKILKTKFKYQLRSVCCSTEKVYVGGIEGAIEVINYSDTSDYFYKGHRVANMVYTVNCIDLNPMNSSLIASGGSDGTLIIYNRPQRYKAHTVKESSAITSCKFTRDGNNLIFATGEDWTKGYPSTSIETKVSVLDLKKARVCV